MSVQFADPVLMSALWIGYSQAETKKEKQNPIFPASPKSITKSIPTIYTQLFLLGTFLP